MPFTMIAQRLRWLPKLAEGETQAGLTSLDLGDGYALVHEESENGVDYWSVYFAGKHVGGWMIKHAADGSEVSASHLSPEHRGKGLGPVVYKTLARHYGGLKSDSVNTNPAAQKAWDRAGADTVPEIDADGGLRARKVIKGDPLRPPVRFT